MSTLPPAQTITLSPCATSVLPPAQRSHTVSPCAVDFENALQPLVIRTNATAPMPVVSMLVAVRVRSGDVVHPRTPRYSDSVAA